MAPIDEVNAIAMKTLSGDMVLVSESLRYFYYFMNVAVYGRQLNLSGIDCLQAALIAVRIINGSEAFDFDIDPRAVFPTAIEQTLQRLTSRQMQFTFGHEFAHIILGHLSTGADRKLQTYDHELEYLADVNAVDLIGDKCARKNILLAGYDVLSFLYFVELAGKMNVGPSFSISRTHPDARSRLERLHEFALKRLVSNARNPDLQVVQQIAEDVSYVATKHMSGEQFTIYGSLYIANFVERRLRDRIDF